MQPPGRRQRGARGEPPVEAEAALRRERETVGLAVEVELEERDAGAELDERHHAPPGDEVVAEQRAGSADEAALRLHGGEQRALDEQLQIAAGPAVRGHEIGEPEAIARHQADEAHVLGVLPVRAPDAEPEAVAEREAEAPSALLEVRGVLLRTHGGRLGPRRAETRHPEQERARERQEAGPGEPHARHRGLAYRGTPLRFGCSPRSTASPRPRTPNS